MSQEIEGDVMMCLRSTIPVLLQRFVASSFHEEIRVYLLFHSCFESYSFSFSCYDSDFPSASSLKFLCSHYCFVKAV